MRARASSINHPEARFLAFWRGRPLVDDRGLCWLRRDHAILANRDSTLYLGDLSDKPRFACLIPHGQWAREGMVGVQFQDIENAEFVSLRSVMGRMTAEDGELAAVAQSLLNWHQTHTFCPNCGHRTQFTCEGWQRHCPHCHTEHFCRINPVVIMLVVHQDNLLLGRASVWPEGMHSLLAGFIEAGETVEAAVARETFEEAGVRVRNVKYVASQPWPFPASLMIGCHAEAINSHINIDTHELESAVWVSRQRTRAIILNRDGDILPPRKGSIAEFMIHLWLDRQTPP